MATEPKIISLAMAWDLISMAKIRFESTLFYICVMKSGAGYVLTEYFPSINTLAYLMQFDTIIIEASENYQKNSLRNRCYLTGSQGKFLLSVPLSKGKNQQQSIRGVKIAYDIDWASIHIKTIKTNYSKAPFFDYYFDNVQSILYKKHQFLLDLNWDILVFYSEAFQWHPSFSFTSEYENPNLDYLSNSKPMTYPQLFENFTGNVPDLSALDLLFCMGPNRKYLEWSV